MRKSKGRLVLELIGPTERVEGEIDAIVATIRQGTAGGMIQVSYPEPCVITPILRNRKPKAPKPERKARKANSQQQPVTQVDDQLAAAGQ